MKPKNTAGVTSFTTRPRTPAQDRSDALEAARTEAREARAQAAATRLWAEATNAQLRAMQALTDTALSHLALDDLLPELLGRVTAVMGVDAVGIALLDADGQTLTLRAARGLGEEDAGRVQSPVGQGFIGRIMASREPVIGDADALSGADFDGADPILRERLRSVAGVPLLVEGPVEGLMEGRVVSRLIGVLVVGSTVPHRFTAADVQLLQRAADRIAASINHARLYAAERDARQRAEAALARAQASEAQATERAEERHTILETMTDGVAVYDAVGRLTQMNRAYRELAALDHAPAGYEARPLRERLQLLNLRDASGAPLLFENTPSDRALRGEVVTRPDADIRARAFDGRELEVNASAAPLRDSAGRIVGAVVVVHDVTWRKQLEREREAARMEAERQADQLDRIFEAAADGLVVWDAEGRMMRMNPAARRILGVDAAPSGFIQLPPRERAACYDTRNEQGRLVPTEEPPFVRTLGAEVGTGTGPEVRDVRMRALDGREIELNVASAPLRDREGHLAGAVVVMHDRTERNRLEGERAAARADELAAREASRRMEAFLATAVHDLRSPLTAVVGYLDLAKRQSGRLAAAARETHPDLASGVEGVHERVEDAGQSAKRLTRLLTLLFDMAAIRADRLELHRATCDLATLVREQVAALRVAAPERTIRLQLPVGDAPVPIEADADRLGQVVVNYVTNALKYSPTDQPVDVSVAVRRRRARVAVCDRGPGLPKEEQARVWELFHRVPGVTAQDGAQGGSLGLGLHISRAIVTAHGGRVGLQSTVGQGSTFWFTLPLAGSRSLSTGTAA
jgi:signal transduction histidine kinase